MGADLPSAILLDGFCRASPAVVRAIHETVTALELQGHECVEFEPPNVMEAMEIFVALTSADACSCLFILIMPPMYDVGDTPPFCRRHSTFRS